MKFNFRPQSVVKVFYDLKKRSAHAEISSFYGNAVFTYFEWPSDDASEEIVQRVILKEITSICAVLNQSSVQFYNDKNLARTMYV